MTSFAAGLYGHLVPPDPADPVLSCGNRVYPLLFPEGGTLPAVVYQVMPGEGALTTHADARGGADPLPVGFTRVRVQFGCWGASYDEAEALGEELVAKLDGFHGAWGDLVVGSVLFGGPLDDYDSTTFTWRRLHDALISYQPAAGL